MLLAIDIGNTTIAIGIYTETELKGHWIIPTKRNSTPDAYWQILQPLIRDSISDCIISCVVPFLKSVFTKMFIDYLQVKPIFINGMNVRLKILSDNPVEVGADRIVNAIAAYHIYKCPAIVVDLGTATTFDIISENGEYLGGVIAPGVAISSETLWTKTALLPQIEIVKPASVIGKNTITSMQAGIFYGFVGQIDGIIKRLINEFTTEVTIIATGGLAELIANESEYIQIINPLLTLEGLKIIYYNDYLLK